MCFDARARNFGDVDGAFRIESVDGACCLVDVVDGKFRIEGIDVMFELVLRPPNLILALTVDTLLNVASIGFIVATV